MVQLLPNNCLKENRSKTNNPLWSFNRPAVADISLAKMITQSYLLAETATYIYTTAVDNLRNFLLLIGYCLAAVGYN